MNETIREEAIKRLGDYWEQTSRMGEVEIDLMLHTRDMGVWVKEAVARFSIARIEMLGKIGDLQALLS